MYAKGKGAAVPSDAQSREKLALYVYEYLIHIGAQKAAQLFLQEIRWEKAITLSEPPGFLTSWWSVFWDLYSAAPERRESFEHSNEAKAFHDYGFVNSGFPNGIGHNPAVPSPLNMPPHDGPGPGGMPPGFYPPPGPPVVNIPNNLELRPGLMIPRLGPPGPGPRIPYGAGMRPGPPSMAPRPGGPMWMPPVSSQYSSASPMPPFNGPPGGSHVTSPCDPGSIPSDHYGRPMHPGFPGGMPPGEMDMPHMMNGVDPQLEAMKHSPAGSGHTPRDDLGPPVSMAPDYCSGGPMPHYSEGMCLPPHHPHLHPQSQQMNGPMPGHPIYGDLRSECDDPEFRLFRMWKDQSECVAIQKLKESMQEDAQLFDYS